MQTLWKKLLEAKGTPILDLQQDKAKCAILIELLATADEASVGAGVPFYPAFNDEFDTTAETLLAISNSDGGANLCDEIRDRSVRVLPKMHAPQSGLTLRSFSHHLAYLGNSEIRPFWGPAGTAPIGDRALDILLLPWPLKISAKSFKKVNPAEATMRNLPDKFGFFTFQHKNSDTLIEEVLKAVRSACAECKTSIDAVIMPELALTTTEYEQLSSILFSQGMYLIAGVGGEPNTDGTTENSVRFNVPLFNHKIPISQTKHHRWKLEESQITNYGLSLPKRLQLWEHIPIGDRSLTFICLRDWLALCVLICEDLARPDPVGDVIRAVGPNLVITLLLDGPQLEGRWSGRYATALADDPGCSVLTLTSAGMTALSNPPGGKLPRKNHGKVALWKDRRGKAHVIDIGKGDAALLHIEVEEREEWIADGRGNEGVSGYPLLKNVCLFKNHKKVKAYNV
ncbi:MAG TPA: hypothetical protein VGU46_07905 [Acidobacteriaceae bacterium]|nr:hypothetical protein [Acidobacteriaceae bacterium]